MTQSQQLTTGALGFEATSSGWRKHVGGRLLAFRRLRNRPDLEQTERLQHAIFGVSERDLASYSLLVVVHKTGGEVLGAFDGARLVGFISGYGGYVDGRPLLVSDFMAVEPDYRGGLGFAIKTLQGALALEAGFEQAIWTVDPLRAANARLNFERLGAHCRRYTRDVYGSDFAEGLYGGMPSDRLTISWPLTSARVAQRLLHGHTPLAHDALADVPDYAPGCDSFAARVTIPGDIDALLAANPSGAGAARQRVRVQLEAAFAAGYVITAFAGAADAEVGYYLLERRADLAE
jgi:predicted GNAT superfamily acetyltransferase